MCGSKGTSTSTSTYSPPANVQANYDFLANQAKSVAATPFQPYTGEMVAGLTPTQEAGIQNVNASAGLAQPYYGAGAGYVQQAATPFGQQQLNQYMSPYINDVVSQTMANLGETNAQQRQQLLGNAISQGAFGGDRAGIAQAELARQQNLATGQTLANVLQGGYGQALGQFNADQARALQAGSTLGQLGAGAQVAGLQGAQAQLGAGAQQQAVQQAQDVANQQQFQAAQAYPFQTTQFLGNLLLGIGGQSGGQALTSTPGPNIGSQVLGGLTTLASIPWGSDERLKENMEPIGETYDGQKIYKFNYKNDGHTMLGLSAQEVEKHHPNAVHKDGEGMRMVDYEKAVNHAAQRGHFAHGGVPDWMGGAVGAEGLGRAHYATDGAIPYSEQPSGGSTKPLTLADVMRVSQSLLADKPGGKTNIPQAPKPQEDGGLMDVAKQLANATPEQRANMKSNVAAIRSNLGLGTVAPADVIPPTNYPDQYAMSGMMGRYASGGVVGRNGYADGQDVKQAAQTTDQPQSLFERVSGQPLSDNARMGLLAAGLGMLSSKSPFFGVGVGEGATAGLGTYYNALANQRAYEKQQRELDMTEEQRNIERERNKIEATRAGYEGMGKNIEAYKTILSGYTPIPTENGLMYRNPRGQLLSPSDYQAEIADMMGKFTVHGVPSMMPPAPAQPAAPAGRKSQEKLGLNDGLVGSTASDTLLGGAGADDLSKKATPSTEAGGTTVLKKSDALTTGSQTAEQPTPEQNKTIPKSVFANVSDDYNPYVLRQKAEGQKRLIQTAEQNGLPSPQGAAALYKDYLERAKAIENNEVQVQFKDGTTGYIPEIQEAANKKAYLGKSMELNAASMTKNDEDLGAKAQTRPEALARINDAAHILELYASGAISDWKAQIPAVAEALGLKIDPAKLDDTAYQQTFTKLATQAMFDRVKDLGGRILVTEIEGQKRANMNPDLQPKTNRNIIGTAKGLMAAEDKFFDDYNNWRADTSDKGGAYASPAQYNLWKAKWQKDNKIDDFIEKGKAATPVKGDLPETGLRRAGYQYIIPADQLGNDMKAQYPQGIKATWTKNGWDKSTMEPVQ